MNIPYPKLFLLFAGAVLLLSGFGPYSDSDKLAYWSFTDTGELYIQEELSGAEAVIHNSLPNPEFVPGVQGTGLRLNSFSSYVEGDLPAELGDAYTIEGWFAIESYPMETAGFVSLFDADSESGLVIGISNFGYPSVGWGELDSVEYATGSEPVERFEWVHMAYAEERGVGSLYVNGAAVLEDIAVGERSPTQFVFGNHFDPIVSDNIGHFTILNALIDEISLYAGALGSEEIERLYGEALPESGPDLSIPDVRFEGDHLRPQYHLQPAANWTNETHGLIYYDGRYHIFNQKNASGLNLRQMNWGHFSSEDLVTWVEHRPVCSPEPGYDAAGCWSGHVVINDEEVPVIFYSGADHDEPYSVAKAYPDDDDLISWTKYEGNPVIHEVPGGFTRTDMRDPYLWKEGNTWYLTIGYGIEEGGTEKGAVLLYKSEDLTNWEYADPLFVGNPDVDDSGIFWEMPIFWQFAEDTYVLLVNKVPQVVDGTRIPANALYWVGRFEDERFIPDFEEPKKLEVINKFLSPSIAEDADGRTITIGIIPVYGQGKPPYERGWTHIFSIPRVWELKDNVIHQTPHPNLKELRRNGQTLRQVEVSSGDSNVLDARGHQLEIVADIDPRDSRQFGFVIAKNPDGSEQTRIYYDFDRQQFVVDASESSSYVRPSEEPRDYSQHGDYALDRDEPVNIHMFIDGAVIEVFVNGRDAFTATILPYDSESNTVDFFATGGSALIEHIEIYELDSSGNTIDW